jgi:hypothetical protein
MLFVARTDSLDCERLAKDRSNPHARIERSVRVLKHHLQIAPPPTEIPTVR